MKNVDEVKKIPLVKSTRRGEVPRSDIGARLTDFIVSKILKTADNVRGARSA